MSNKEKKYISYLQIASNLGLTNDDTLLLSSDISKLIYNTTKNGEQFNTHEFIKSFETQLKHGNLIFPTFINDFKTGNNFNLQEKKTDSGVLSTHSLNLKNFGRNIDPLHSFSFTGKNFSDFLKIKPQSTFGSDSFFSKLVDLDSKMLIIDLDFNHAFTFAHFVEESINVKYRKFKIIDYNIVNENKTERCSIKFYSKKFGYKNDLNNLHSYLLQKGALFDVKINQVAFTIIELKKAYNIIKNGLIKNEIKIVKFNLYNFIKDFLKSFINA